MPVELGAEPRIREFGWMIASTLRTAERRVGAKNGPAASDWGQPSPGSAHDAGVSLVEEALQM